MAFTPEQQTLIWRIGERIADEVEKVAAGRQSDCEAAARDVYALAQVEALTTERDEARQSEAELEQACQDLDITIEDLRAQLIRTKAALVNQARYCANLKVRTDITRLAFREALAEMEAEARGVIAG